MSDPLGNQPGWDTRNDGQKLFSQIVINSHFPPVYRLTTMPRTREYVEHDVGIGKGGTINQSNPGLIFTRFIFISSCSQ